MSKNSHKALYEQLTQWLHKLKTNRKKLVKSNNSQRGFKER